VLKLQVQWLCGVTLSDTTLLYVMLCYGSLIRRGFKRWHFIVMCGAVLSSSGDSGLSWFFSALSNTDKSYVYF